MLYELVLKNRSYRRFYQDYNINQNILKDLIELARISPSPRNYQPLKFILSNNRDRNESVFKTLSWAGYLKDGAPKEGERPAAYIIVLGDRTISPDFQRDSVYVAYGIAAQSICLGAVEKNLGCCIIGAIKREELKKIFNIEDIYEILGVIALGKPKEQIIIEPVQPDGSIRYWRDEQQVHHVPKRSIDSIILNK